MNTSATAVSRVVVTGMGCMTPSGSGTDALWQAMLRRRGAIKPRYTDPAEEQNAPASCCRWEACIGGNSPPAAEKPAGGWRSGGDRATDLLTLAADQAMQQAGLDTAPELCEGVPVYIGSGAGATGALFETYRSYFEKGPQRIRPTAVPRCMANALSSRLAIRYRLSGPNFVTVSACSSATVAIGAAFRMIRHGLVERAVCGGVDSPFDPVTRNAWDRLGVLTRSRKREEAVLPFDRRRDGFVLGEGAGVLVLESLASAQQRKTAVLGEIIGYGESSDATHPVQPDAAGQARCMAAALHDAGIEPAAIRLIVAHGTATAINDKSESRAIHETFGRATASIPVLSLKPLWGHMLGASGAVEAIAALHILRFQKLPPDPLPHRENDPECALKFCPPRAADVGIDYLMKNSFAFGGNNAALVFGKPRR